MRIFIVCFFFAAFNIIAQQEFEIDGELQQWHGVKITFNGPLTSEDANPNPFTDYRLNVLFTHSDTSYLVPGFYAADGNSAETGATSGNKWRVIFTPDRTGDWDFKVLFRRGNFISVDTSAFVGEPDLIDGITGAFYIHPSDKNLPDFRSQGMLLYDGSRYLQFTGSNKHFIKGGSNSPENFLAYFEFDDTRPKHRFESHIKDWTSGDPVWHGGKGTGLIGSINYLASKGLNSLYMLTYNLRGDGNDIWPYADSNTTLRFDCSKLGQWDILFTHMQSKGILCHFVTQETENDQLLNNGNLGPERKLYYRELIARFGYHPALIWNLGEEITNTTEQIKDFAKYIKAIDPYDHFVTLHNINYNNYSPLLGFPYLDGPSMYIYNIDNVNRYTKRYINESASSGRQWVCFLDEIGPYDLATPPDDVDPGHHSLRKKVLWGHLMAGGAGLEWYMGYDYPHNDLTLEDFRTRDQLWNQTFIAMQFFNSYLPYTEMHTADELVTPGNHCIAKENEIYAVYLPNGGGTFINLPDKGPYQIWWYNPRTGSPLLQGTRTHILNSGEQYIGLPPEESKMDWAVIISKQNPQNQAKRLDFISPYNIVLNDTSEKIDIKVRVLDSLGNPGISADPVVFHITGPGTIDGNTSVIPENGYAAVKYKSSSDTGTAYIKAVYQNIIADSMLIRITNQITIENFEDYLTSEDLRNEWYTNELKTNNIQLEDNRSLSGINSLKVSYDPEIDNDLIIKKDFSRSYAGVKYLSFKLYSAVSGLNISLSLISDSLLHEFLIPVTSPGEHFHILALDSFSLMKDTNTSTMNVAALQIKVNGEVGLPAGEILFDDFIFSTVQDVQTDVDQEDKNFHLLQNYPNPFNQSTKISYYLSKETDVHLTIHDILGNLVTELFAGTQPTGNYNFKWTPANISSGIYLIRLQTNDFTKSIKSVLLK